MDEYDSGSRNTLDSEFPLELELEEPISKPQQKVEVDQPKTPSPQQSQFASDNQQTQKSPFASNNQQTQKSPFASNNQQTQNTSPSATSPQSAKKNAPAEPQIVFYDMEEKKNDTLRLLIFTTAFGLIGALCFAGISAVYYSIGRRIGILFVAFFATLGARLGTDQLRGNRVRWYAAFTAAGSSVAAKGFLVLMLFNMYPSFTAEDWTNFADPGKSAAIYFDESVKNALSTDGSDQRSGQERLDDRFEQEYEDPDSTEEGDAWEDADSDEEDYQSAKLSFSQIFPKLFDIFDIPLILAAMFFAFRLSRNES